jgi:hypothetical protein
MYLTHHYLIDVVSGACLATAFFYLFLPDEFKGSAATAPPGGLSQRSKYEIYDLEAPRPRGNGRAHSGFIHEAEDFDLASETSSHASDEEEVDIAFRSPVPGATPTSALGLMSEQQKSAVQQQQQQQAVKKSHRHTASIASLIRADERAEDGWSPIGSGFTLPPTPTRTEMEEGRR